jgi:methionyl aminopeptidase
VLAEHGARSSPPLVYGFPGDVCIRINDEVVHGIPGERVLQRGDLVKLDLTAELDGYHTDSAKSVEVPPATGQARELPRCAEREVRRRGFHLIKELGGHGIGRTIHEPPSVPNYADFSAQHKLTEGLVITIEPIIAAGTGNVSVDQDRWTYRTTHGSLSAHYEHTIVITRGEPSLLTAV